MTVLISSAAACLLSEAVLLAAAFAALCLLITLHSIAYRMAIDSVATSVQSRFQLAAAAEANDELTYIMSPALSETESIMPERDEVAGGGGGAAAVLQARLPHSLHPCLAQPSLSRHVPPLPRPAHLSLLLNMSKPKICPVMDGARF
ncbi:hypothetical protein GOP47_0003733 [Adiantum capillus-veneris]|uniref:Uncharacterized protein n=1 Tax=Adiantum capillus-veneris TaxID=13818 RepID=A0A9D4V663_ADICA|nr:hypothetical protein GOP47_0003733 [Adiantum capillus-veneris]